MLFIIQNIFLNEKRTCEEKAGATGENKRGRINIQPITYGARVKEVVVSFNQNNNNNKYASNGWGALEKREAFAHCCCMTERSEMPRLEVVEGKIISLSAFSSPINKWAVVVLCLSCVCDLLRCVSALLLFLQKNQQICFINTAMLYC